MKIALAVALALLALGVGLTLVHSPMTVASTNRVNVEATIASATQSAGYCQAHEVLPRGTSAIRISLQASIGPRVKILVSSGGHSITSGEQGSGWTGDVVTVPVKPLPRTVSAVTVCVSFRLRNETIALAGHTTPAALAAREGANPLLGRMRIEYLHPGTRSWMSLVPAAIRHMALGRASTGTWIAYLALIMIVAIAALASSLVLKELL